MAKRDDNWNSYQKLVLSKLDDHAGELVSLKAEVKSIREKDVPELKIDIATLKVKAGVWGATAGAIPGVLAVIYIWLKYVPVSAAQAAVGPAVDMIRQVVSKQ